MLSRPVFRTFPLSEPPRKHESSRGTHAFAVVPTASWLGKQPRKHGTQRESPPSKRCTPRSAPSIDFRAAIRDNV